MKIGIICASDNELAPLTVDMETAGIAHVCYVNAVPFIAIRCVTDTASHSAGSSFEENLARASEIAKKVTVSLIKAVRNEQSR